MPCQKLLEPPNGQGGLHSHRFFEFGAYASAIRRSAQVRLSRLRQDGAISSNIKGGVTMLSIFQHIPVWVFIVFIVLLMRGLNARADREISAIQALILPLAMILWSMSGVVQGSGLGLMGALAWLIAASLVFVAYWVLNGPQAMWIRPETGKLHIRGSWQPLCLMMLAFFSHFVSGTLQAVQPHIASMPPVQMGFAAIYGAVSGVFLARFIAILQLVLAGPRWASTASRA